MANDGMMILDYVLGFDYLVVFILGVSLGIWLTNRCIRKGVQMTQDIQTNYPFDNDFKDKEITKE